MKKSYTVEKLNKEGTNLFYTFDERTPKGELLQVGFWKVVNDHKGHLINLWYKKGWLKEPVKSYWSIDVYVTDQKGECHDRYNPTVTKDHKVNFDWVIEATEENKEKLLDEIVRLAYQQPERKGKTLLKLARG